MLLSFLCLAPGKDEESFNVAFLNAWKTTHNYKMWNSSRHLGVLEVNPGYKILITELKSFDSAFNNLI